jgi:hypothetical protein
MTSKEQWEQVSAAIGECGAVVLDALEGSGASPVIQATVCYMLHQSCLSCLSPEQRAAFEKLRAHLDTIRPFAVESPAS